MDFVALTDVMEVSDRTVFGLREERLIPRWAIRSAIRSKHCSTQGLSTRQMNRCVRTLPHRHTRSPHIRGHTPFIGKGHKTDYSGCCAPRLYQPQTLYNDRIQWNLPVGKLI